MTTQSTAKKYTILFLLILAGSAIYELAYVRYNYYDAMMAALQVDHTQMGNLMSVYGIGAMICYFPGGWLADRISCKKLLAFSLIATALGGFYFATFPSYSICLAIHVFWAITNTLTFWAAMLKATRQLGDSSEQGRMFGILEGGRGLAPMIYGFVILRIFSAMGSGVDGFRGVIIGYSVVTLIAGILVVFFLSDHQEEEVEETGEKHSSIGDIIEVIKMPQIWLLSTIIFASYVAYTGQSYITPYLTDIYGLGEDDAALIGLIRVYFIAIFAGPIGGFLADKVKSTTKVLFMAFIVITISAGVYIVIPPEASYLTAVIGAMIVLAASVFVTRGIYFAAIDELNIPIRLTGVAIGVASMVGFMPEAFIYTLIGSWLDGNPGAAGYKIMFTFVTVLAATGFVFSGILLGMIKKAKNK